MAIEREKRTVMSLRLAKIVYYERLKYGLLRQKEDMKMNKIEHLFSIE